MRFLTLGSTPSLPNQPPKIISTGNAFLTSEKNNLCIPSIGVFFPLISSLAVRVSVCVCVYVSPIFWPYFWRLWFRHYKMAQDTSEVYFLNAAEVRGALVGDLFFRVSLVLLFHEEGAHTKDWWEGKGGWEGVERGWEGGGERAGSDEPQPKRKTHSFSSVGREGGNSQLCRHNTTMNVRVGCEVLSCCEWQAGKEEKEMPLSPPTI